MDGAQPFKGPVKIVPLTRKFASRKVGKINMQTTTLKITKLGGTPVFMAYSTDPRFAKVYGATRIPPKDLWYYPAFHPLYRFVLRDFHVLQVPLELSEAAHEAVQKLDRYAARIQNRELPEGFTFKTPPFQHQLEGLVHVLYNFRAALFYACGLGKTKIVIDWQRALDATLLVLCPRVVVKVWPQEAARHGIDQEFAVIDATSRKGKLKQLEDAKNYPAVVISYDSMRRYQDELSALSYNVLVADESHYIKNPTSARTKVAIELSKKASRRIIMSGTPSTGNPLDMWSQFRFLSPCFLAEPFWKFKQDYCVTSKSNKHIVVGFKNLDVLNRRIEIVSLRKTKKECLDLPAQRIINLWLDLTTAQRRVYNTLVHTDEFEALHTAMVAGELFNQDGLIDVPNAAILVNKLIQVTCGFVYLKPNEPSPCHGCEHLRDCVTAGIKPHTASCKVDPVARPPVIERMASNAKLVVLLSKLTEILVEPTHKCIVWCQFGAEMDWVQEAIEAHWEKHRQDFTLVRVDGSTNKPDRLVDRFNQDPRCRVYLGQVETGVGITLNAANYMIYFSLPWKLLAYDQSLDRNHRLGQERDVTVFRLLARGTIDTHIARALSLKRTVSETLVATLRCGRCDRQKRCEDSGISLFEPGCKFQRRVARPVARPRSI